MHARDLAKVISIIIKKNMTESFNIATSENYSVKKIANIALQACEFENTKLIFDRSMPNGQLRKDIDIKKLKRLIPRFKPILLKDGIREIYLKKKEGI